MTLYRIATVKATGKKYLVNYLDFRAGKAVCWGEVLSSRGVATKHGPTEVFALDEVTIGPEGPRTQALIDELFNQSVEARREQGRQVSVKVTPHGNIRATDHGKPRS